MSEPGMEQPGGMGQTDPDNAMEIATLVLCPHGVGIDLDPLIDTAGVGFGNLYTFGFAALCWIATGFVSAQYTFLLPALHCAFDTTLAVSGLPASAAYFGIFCASTFWSVLMDRYGRLNVIRAAVVVMVGGVVLSALSRNFWLIVVLQFFVGFGMSAPLNLALTFMLEYCPAASRGTYGMALNIASGMAVITAIGIPWLVLNRYGWRVQLLLSVVPSIVLLVVGLSVRDTPRFHLVSGQHSKVLGTVFRAAYLNGTLEALHDVLCAQVFAHAGALLGPAGPTPGARGSGKSGSDLESGAASGVSLASLVVEAHGPGPSDFEGARGSGPSGPEPVVGLVLAGTLARRCFGLRLWRAGTLRLSLRDVADRLIMLAAYCHLAGAAGPDARAGILRRMLEAPAQDGEPEFYVRRAIARIGAVLPRWVQAVLPPAIGLSVDGTDKRIWGFPAAECPSSNPQTPIVSQNDKSDYLVDGVPGSRSGTRLARAQERVERVEFEAVSDPAPHAPPLFAGASTSASERGRIQDLFHPMLRRTTLLLGAIWFFAFFSQDAFFFSLPNLLSTRATDCPVNFPSRVYLSVLLSLSLIIPMTVLSIFIVDRPQIGRRYACALFATAGCTAVGTLMVLLFVGADPMQPVSLVFFVILAALTVGASNVITSMVVVYTTEVYPTVLRAAGVGYLGLYSGFGSTAAPFVLGVFLEFVSQPLFFLTVAAMFGVTAVLLVLLPYEPCGKCLAELTETKPEA